MKTNPFAFVIVVVTLRLTSVYLVLAAVYQMLSLPWLQLVAGGGMGGFILIGIARPLVASVVLWFLSIPVAKFVLVGLDEALNGTKN